MSYHKVRIEKESYIQMKIRLVLLLALVAASFSTASSKDVDEVFMDGYDVFAASINTAAKENSISLYRNDQIIILKPDPKGKNNKPVAFTATIKENGDLGKPKLSKELSSLDISGTVAYDSINGKLYFSKYNKIEKDYALYESSVYRGKWSAPVKMKIEGTGGMRDNKPFMVSGGWSYKEVGLSGFKNPCIANNGKRIYFTAKLRGKEYANVGGTDIWFVDLKEDGVSWTLPQNAGTGINSRNKEDYAFCLGDSVMYYSSFGAGGMAIFKSKFENGEWSKGVALPKPFSSSMRDFNMIVDRRNIYFVSTRYPKGKDDIYLFRKKPDPVVVPPPIEIPPVAEPDAYLEKKYNWNFVLFYFDFDKDVLTDEFIQQFGQLVEEMKQFPGETFEVAGHTDQKGSDKYNQKLSERRAEFVKQMLVKEGFPEDKIITKGFGESMPVVEDPQSDDDFAQNRRCEIRIISDEVNNLPSAIENSEVPQAASDGVDSVEPNVENAGEPVEPENK